MWWERLHAYQANFLNAESDSWFYLFILPIFRTRKPTSLEGDESEVETGLSLDRSMFRFFCILSNRIY